MNSAVTGLVLSVAALAAAAWGAPPPARADLGRIEMPRNCSQHKYCTEPHHDYPHQLINKLLAQYKVSLGHPHENDIFRDGWDSVKQNDCEHTYSYARIYEIEDQAGDVRVVVQAKNFTQQVRIEKCEHPGQLNHRTDHFTDEDVQNHNITCEDNRMAYSFLVLSLDGRRLEAVASQPAIPVYCACRLN